MMYIGQWIARAVLRMWDKIGKKKVLNIKGGKDRGKYYLHSTFCDLVISGLIGLRPAASSRLVIHPLVPQGTWSYFCLDRVKYHGKFLTIVWDQFGARYHLGAGFKIYVDGVLTVSKRNLRRVVLFIE